MKDFVKSNACLRHLGMRRYRFKSWIARCLKNKQAKERQYAHTYF